MMRLIRKVTDVNATISPYDKRNATKIFQNTIINNPNEIEYLLHCIWIYYLLLWLII